MSKSTRILSIALCILLVFATPLQTQATEEGIVLRIVSEEGFLNFANSCRLDSYSVGLTVILC